MTVGDMVRHFLTKLEWYSTLFPRIPVPVQVKLHTEIDCFKPLVKKKFINLLSNKQNF